MELLILAGLSIGWLVHRDANHLARRVGEAEKLMTAGMPENEATSVVGLDFWERPWYRRFFSDYTALV